MHTEFFPPILELGNDFYDPVQAAVFPEKTPRFLNQSWAQKIGLSLPQEKDWIQHFAEFQPLPSNLPTPLALRYHGHQFLHYNPDIGDGRGFLHAQILANAKLLDLGTKGSGQTPYSRQGDGRLTLKGAMREALATEQLESLGVTTSKTFCFFETGEKLERGDEPSPTRSAVLTRLSHSHVRFGTFQRLAYFKDTANIQKLLEYCIRHFADGKPTPELYFASVVEKTARLVAEWMLAGFVHGVLNTDNMNINGESFDYGPYRFLPHYDVTFTAAYFDRTGLYSYGRQPHAVLWNLRQLAESLRLAEPKIPYDKILATFDQHLHENALRIFFQRLNLKPQQRSLDEQLFNRFFAALEKTKVPFEQAFFDHFSGASLGKFKTSPDALFYEHPHFQSFYEILKNYETQNLELDSHPYFQNDSPCTLLIDQIESIWKDIAEKDNWSTFNAKIDQIRSFREIYNLF